MPVSYDEFKDKVGQALRQAGGPITWSEVRERAGLHQKFPNNQWVRRMEADIGLKRGRDKGGRMLWGLG
jgi:hypothetical protein